MKSKLAEWQLALPLGLAFAALFLTPLLLLIGVSFFNDEKMTQPGFQSWLTFFGDRGHTVVPSANAITASSWFATPKIGQSELMPPSGSTTP